MGHTRFQILMGVGLVNLCYICGYHNSGRVVLVTTETERTRNIPGYSTNFTACKIVTEE